VGLRIGPACETGLSAGMRRERVPPQRIKKEERKNAYRGVDIEGDRIGKRCSIDGYKDNVFGEDGRLVDGDSTARSTGHVRAHATVADHFVD